MNDKAMFSLTYGLFVLTAQENGKDNGCIINTAMQVTAQPNRISIAVNKANHTHDMIVRTGKFNISVLSEKAEFETFRHFGFQSGKDVNKFENYNAWKRSDNGIAYVTEGTNAWISGMVEQMIDLGTHTLFIASVDDMDVLTSDPSASYAYYHAHIKPQPQVTKKTGKTAWRCKICGYVYEGEELPADYICPICKHPASDFEKIEL